MSTAMSETLADLLAAIEELKLDVEEYESLLEVNPKNWPSINHVLTHRRKLNTAENSVYVAAQKVIKIYSANTEVSHE